jgi:hypothetical protein
MLTSGAKLVCMFLWNKHRPYDGEAFWNEYLNEVENLKRERVADFLSRALANLERKCVMIFTNKGTTNSFSKWNKWNHKPGIYIYSNNYWTLWCMYHQGHCWHAENTWDTSENSGEEQNDETLYARHVPLTYISTTPRKSATYNSPVKSV